MEIITKYDVGQKLWAMYQNKVQEFTIESVEVSVSLNYREMKPYNPIEKYKLRIGESAGSRLEAYDCDLERDYFGSKEDLLKSL